MASIHLRIGQHVRLEFVLCYSGLLFTAFISSVTNSQNSNPSHSSCSDICDYASWSKIANCSNRNVTSIPEACVSAKALQLNNNRITRLNPDAFQGFTNLRFLYLRSNTLSGISSDAFRGLEELEYLRLGGNCFSDLNREILRGLDNLVFLLALEGCLENIAARTFEVLPNLSTLELGGNRLHEPLCGAFGVDNVLQSLTLADNLINSLPDFCFAELDLLRILSLDGNNLTEIRSDRELSGLNSLQTLSLEESSLIQISKNSFKNTPRIKYLSLARNGLSDLPTDVFESLSNLTIISLSNNALDHVSAKLFRNNLRLEEVDLSANRITQIEAGAFTGLQHLSTLQLTANRIKLIYHLIQELPWINLANLADNPLRCECAVLDLGDWLDRNAKYATKCVFLTPREREETGEHSLQTLCNESDHMSFSSQSSVTTVESQESNLGLPDVSSNKTAPKPVEKPDTPSNSKAHPHYLSFTTNTIIVAITIVLPVVFIIILFGIVYHCHRILKTSDVKSKGTIRLSPTAEDAHAGLIGLRQSSSITQSNGLSAVAADNETGGTCENDGLYEELSSIESKMNSPCLLKKIHSDTDSAMVTRSASYVEVLNDTYVLYDPPRLPDSDYEVADDQEKTAARQGSEYYNFGENQPVYDSKIPRYVNQREFLSS